MDNNLSSFDAQMKAALDNLEVPYEPSTWAALEQRLPKPSAADAVDQAVFSTLINLEVPYEPSTWAALEQRLPKPPAADVVDKAVFSTLNNLEAPYQSSHWAKLAERMAEQTRLRRRLWASKLAEAAVFLLLLANLDGLLGDGPAPAPLPATPPPSDKPIAEKTPRRHPSTPTGAAAAQSSATASTSGEAGLAENFAAHTMLLATDGQTSGTTDNQQIGTNTSAQITAGTPLENPFFSQTPMPLQADGAASTPGVSVSTAAVPQQVFAWLAPLSATPQGPLFLDKKNVNTSVFRFATPVLSLPEKAPKQQRFYASSIASLEKNRVKVEGADLQITPSYGGGFAAGYRKRKWGVEVGVAYSEKRFRPRKEVKIVPGGNINKGYYGAYVREVNADVVAVPVKATRRIAKVGRLTAHAVAGLTANIAVEKSYQNKTVFYPGFQPQPGTDPVPKPTIFAQTGDGLLEGGSLDGNSYLSATAGLRLEHPVGKRYTVFVEGAYNPALTRQGIGPKSSQINTLALNAGVMAGL